jgi:hypothetical protein
MRGCLRPAQLFVRCLAERKRGYWQAVCLDFDLMAQGDSFAEVRAKLDAMVSDYVFDALEGDDRDHAAYFLTRRAPWRFWAKFYWYQLLRGNRATRGPGRRHRPFRDLLPLTPTH